MIFAPAGNLVPEALRALNKGGTLALAGIYMTQIPPLDYDKHLYYEKTVRSVTASTRRDGEELLQLAADIPIRTKTAAVPPGGSKPGLQLLKAGKINGAAVLAMEQ